MCQAYCSFPDAISHLRCEDRQDGAELRNLAGDQRGAPRRQGTEEAPPLRRQVGLKAGESAWGGLGEKRANAGQVVMGGRTDGRTPGWMGWGGREGRMTQTDFVPSTY